MSSELMLPVILFLLFLLGFLIIVLWLNKTREKLWREKLQELVPGEVKGQNLLVVLDKLIALEKQERLDRKKQWLQWMDELSIGLAFFYPQKGALIGNRFFATYTGNHKASYRWISLSEMPFFAQVVNKVDSSQDTLQLGRLEFLVQKFDWEEGKVIFLKDLSWEEKWRRKMSFFSTTLWHEIKTPITSLKGYIQVFLEESNNPFLSEVATKAESQVRKIEALINNLKQFFPLSLEKEEKTVCTSSEVKACLERVIDFWKKDLEENSVCLLDDRSWFEKDEFMLSLSPTDFYLIFSSLFSNAVKFNRVGGEIKIFPRIENGYFVLTVQNTALHRSAYMNLKEALLQDEWDNQKKGNLGIFFIQEILDKVQGKIELGPSDGKLVSLSLFLPLVATTR